MVAVLVILFLLILLLGGFGFAVHMLWWLAIAALVVFLVMLLFGNRLF